MTLHPSNMQLTYWNPGASMPLIVPIWADCNTSDAALAENIRVNSRATDKWVELAEAHDRVAVICGSGPSLADDLAAVASWESSGATIFALNGAAKFLGDHSIEPHYQVILDAREETANLVWPGAKKHLLASQVHPKTLASVPGAWLYHCEIGGTDDLLPRQEGYVLIHGSASVGNTALPLVYALGYRKIHLYGYDSSHKGAKSHPFPQPMNAGEPCAHVSFNGKQYLTSFVMKMQAERFQQIARILEEMGCELHVHGYGLLPDMWRAPAEELSERDKYERVWGFPQYRAYAPGEECVAHFLQEVNPSAGSRVIDFGCGTGRAGLKLKAAGLDPVLLDFAVNARDPEAYSLPFLQSDLTQRIPIPAPYGFCTDVLEHIPPADVETVVSNIMAAARTVYFQISTVPDSGGALIGQPLHLMVRPHAWWLDLFCKDYRVAFGREGETTSQFVVTRKD